MIIALEGPDGSGKTTMFQSMQRAPSGGEIYVDFPSMGAKLWPFAQEIENRDVQLFKSLYAPSTTYVTDRFFAVTGPVYAKAFGREVPDYRDEWYSQVHVIYLASPEDLLLERIRQRDQVQKSKEARQIVDRLHRVIAEYQCFLFQGHMCVSIIPNTHDICETQARVQECIRRHLNLR